MRCFRNFEMNLFIFSTWLLLIWTRQLAEGASSYEVPDNTTTLLERHKRNLPLVFPLGGTSKLLLGFALPVPNPVNINLIFALNFQYQYAVPPNISFFTQYYPFVQVARRKRDAGDGERNVFYQAVEGTMDRFGVDGRECLLRTICEAAESPVHHNGLIGELFHLLLTPPIEDVIESGGTSNSLESDDDYTAARKAGEQFYDCKELYPKCPIGHGLFDTISYFE